MEQIRNVEAIFVKIYLYININIIWSNGHSGSRVVVVLFSY